MTIPLDKIENMPAFSPYYPSPPARYRNVCFQFVYFRADIAAVDRILPDCFEVAEDGFCVGIGLSVPWSSNYGQFAESLLLVKCLYEGQVGFFSPVVFLNSRGSIPAGREIYGTPKVFAEVKVAMDERVMTTDTHLAGTSVLSLRSTMHRVAEISELPKLTPSWRLKVIPRADGTGPEVMQLIDGSDTTTDINVHVCCSGDGTVEFHRSPIYDLADFRPKELLGAHYVEMDYTEGFARIERDFLKH